MSCFLALPPELSPSTQRQQTLKVLLDGRKMKRVNIMKVLPSDPHTSPKHHLHNWKPTVMCAKMTLHEAIFQEYNNKGPNLPENKRPWWSFNKDFLKHQFTETVLQFPQSLKNVNATYLLKTNLKIASINIKYNNMKCKFSNNTTACNVTE